MTFEGLLHGTLNRRVTVLMLALASIVVGVIAYVLVPVELLPKGFTEESVTIWIPVPASTPLEVQEQIIRPTEEQVRTVPGIREITSVAGPNRASIRVQLSRDVDLDLAVAELRDRVERARPAWPEQVRDYVIRRFNLDTDLPIFSFAIDLERESDEVTFLIDEKVKKPLEALPGVAMVDCWGLLEDQIRINVDRDEAIAQGVDIYRLTQTLTASNLELAGGEVEDAGRRLSVRTDARFRDLDDLRNFPINRAGLRLGQIATIEPGKAVRNFIALARNKRSLWFQIKKESNANTVATADLIRRTLKDKIETDRRLAELGAKVRFYERADLGALVTGAITTLRESAAIGSILAIAVLFYFLRRLAPTLIIALALPLSLLLTLGWMHFSGGSLNILSLLGLTVAVGMLVDNAIVVVENITRHRDAGLARIAAAKKGVGEVALAITLSTLTTVAAFLPVIFMGGNAELAFFAGGIGLPLCVAVLASLAVALVFIPLATVVFDRGAAPARVARGPTFGERFVGSLVRRALSARLAWILIVGLLTGGVTAVLNNRVPKTDIMSDAGGWISLDIEFDKNFTLADANRVFKDYGAWLDAHAEEFGVEHFWCFFDRRGGEFAIDLSHLDMAKSKETAKAIKAALPPTPGVRTRMSVDDGNQSERDKPSVSIFGPDPQVLVRLAAEVAGRLEAVPGVLSAQADLVEADDEIQIRPDRTNASRYGVDPRSLRGTLEYGVHGWQFSDLVVGEREIPLIIQFQGADTRDLRELKDLPVRTEAGSDVKLSSLASITVTRGLSEIRRTNGRSRAIVTVESSDTDKEALRRKLRAAAAVVPLPEGYTFEEAGTQRVDAAMGELYGALTLAIVLIFLLMGVLFESFILPLAVLVTIPFSWAGMVWALALTRTPLDFVGGIGVLVLVGVVVNNGIVLIDCAHRFRADGLGRTEALVEAARTRLRPILMTALTTVLGLVPTALAKSSGSQISYKALSLAVIGGLSVSTFFTLVFVPLLYTLFDDLRLLASRTAAALSRRREPRPQGQA